MRAVWLPVVSILVVAVNAAEAVDCSRIGELRVPGAERQMAACLDDLSTRYLIATGHTDISDWSTLHSQHARNPSGAVPGIQIDGNFADTSTTNGTRGWNRRKPPDNKTACAVDPANVCPI
jgi:hypothetical protein